MFGFLLDIYVGTSSSFRQLSLIFYILTLQIHIRANLTAEIYRKICMKDY